MNVSLSISGMNCGHCVKALSAELERVPGLSALSVGVGSASFQVGSLDEAAVRLTVAEAGFEVVELRTTAS